MEPNANTDSTSDPVRSNAQAESSPVRALESGRVPRVVRLALVAVLLAAILGAMFWVDTRNRIDLTREEVARRLRDVENQSREAHALARASQDMLREPQARLGQIETRLAESQSQQLALEALYQELSRTRDEWQLAEIEQVLAIASQQLQLSGDVHAALLALQFADSRLARADRPQFQLLRRALARDIGRLKALPGIDVPGMSIKLDRLIVVTESMPLAFEERPGRVPSVKSASATSEGWWARFGGQVWSELKQLVVVRRVDVAEPELLVPSQAYFLRENLRLRLLNARLSMLSRDEPGYREDLRVARAWINRYFDTRSKSVAGALSLLSELAAASLVFQPPGITDSLEAVRAFKTRREQ